MIEYLNGKWYLLLQRRGGLLTIERGGERKEVWGAIQNSSGHKCWSLDETGFTQASINDLPDPLLKINMLMDYAPVGELVALDGTRVTLAQKAEFKGKYPLNPSDQRIERPPLTVTKP